MIKPNEVRLGNCFGYYGDQQGEILSLKLSTMSDTSSLAISVIKGGYTVVALDELKPIPLTKEWLLKFGFKQDIHNQFFYDKGAFSIKRNIYSDKETDYSLCGNVSCINFKYVHQLQNLYFALTGEELPLVLR